MKVTPSMAHHASVLTAISATVIGSALWFAPGANAEIQVVSAWRAEGATALVGVDLPAPAKNDAASQARLRISGGVVDSNSGGISKLRDGKLPTEADQPDENFFFAAGTTGGRLSLDLERVVEVQQINTYSRHPDTRGPQVYKLFASAGTEPGFVERLEKSADPSANGWKLIATVDTRAKSGPGGGEHRVSISDSEGMLGRFRYLLFEISRTEADDDFGNTFYSEIDVIENGAAAESVANAPYVFKTADGSCEFTIDTAEAADLRDWAVEKLAPTLAEWYPKIVALLPSEDYTAPKAVTISIRPINGVAFASGPRITANSDWLRRELKGEAIGALVHEAVHVVQQYGGGRRNRSTEYKHPPDWLGEGIPDYIRFFLYEPQSHGADLLWLQGRRNQALNYDGMYRITANFLNFVVEKYDAKREFITKINAACRQGKYADELWLELTGKSLASLNDEWKAATKLQLETKAASGLNTLTEAEKSAGWRLLFNGVDFAGWHNFKRDGVRPGWQVKDGALVCVDPHDAGDLVTTDKFAAFELQLEYNISEGGNSGIMYHVTDEGGAAWATGPEFQLEDNAKAKDPQRCGWLYALYQPENDPQTGQPLDATKPAGEWNHVRLVISPDKCEHWINGVKYFEYVKGSDDFKARIAESKFSKMPLFAKADSGSLALQGDHGQISFRNIKVRSLRTRVTEARASNQ